MGTPERILVRTDYDGTHDGTWIAAAPYEPPIEYTGSEPQYVRVDKFDAQAATIKELTEALEDIKARAEPAPKYHGAGMALWWIIGRANAALTKAKGGDV